MFLWVKDFHASFFIKKVEKEDIFSKGDNTIKEFCKVITRIPGFSPYEYQLNLMSIVLEMIIPTFYWYMWQDYKSIVLKRYNQKSIPQICSSCAARRDGKSTFFQMVCIGLALCVPRRQNEYRYGVGLVSINLNGSIKMIQDIYDMMLLLNYPGVKIVHTATKIIVKHSDGINAILGFQTGESMVSKFSMWISCSLLKHKKLNKYFATAHTISTRQRAIIIKYQPAQHNA